MSSLIFFMVLGAPCGDVRPFRLEEAVLEERTPTKMDEALTDRAALEERWLALTRDVLPAAAKGSDWPASADHCFQRILLDNAAGTVWYNVIEKRPAYRHAPEAILVQAIALGESVLSGTADLWQLNQESLRMRGKRGPRTPSRF
ncbi:MAG: hypothetical protein AAGG79_02500 [Pseudomonadota bacterium]